MVLAMFSLCAAVSAAPPTFLITQVFSNIDGSLQFIALTESAGLDGQHHFAGLTLTSTHNGVTRRYTFPADLPTEHTSYLSVLVGASDYGKLPVVVGGTSYNDGSPYNCCYQPTFNALPQRFIATDGAVLDFAGVRTIRSAQSKIVPAYKPTRRESRHEGRAPSARAAGSHDCQRDLGGGTD